MKKKCTQIFYLRICIKLHALCNLQAICVGKIPCHVHVMEARLQEVMRAQLEIIIQNLAARKIIGPAIKARTKIDSLIHESIQWSWSALILYHDIITLILLWCSPRIKILFLFFSGQMRVFSFLSIWIFSWVYVVFLSHTHQIIIREILWE